MLDRDKRWIQFNELHLPRDPEHSPIIEIAQMVPGLVQRTRSKEAAKLIDNERAAIRITDVKEFSGQQILVFLVQYVNSNMASPSIGDLDTGIVRHEQLLQREGVAVSAHVAVSMKSRFPHALPPQYMLLLEEVPGIGRSVLQPFLRWEFKEQAKDWSWLDDTDNNREKRYHPVVDIHTLTDITLGEEIEQGSVITAVELFQHVQKNNGIDEYLSIRESERILILKPTSQKNILENIKNLWPIYRAQGYENMKIRYKNISGRQKTGVMGSSESDIADTLLGRSKEIRTDETLSQCHERIVPSLANQMVSELVRARG